MGGVMVIEAWQPIDTAPRDGSSILLAVPGWKAPVIGWWRDERRLLYGKQVAHDQKWMLGPFKPEGAPSHWMPLPRLPDANA